MKLHYFQTLFFCFFGSTNQKTLKSSSRKLYKLMTNRLKFTGQLLLGVLKVERVECLVIISRIAGSRIMQALCHHNSVKYMSFDTTSERSGIKKVVMPSYQLVPAILDDFQSFTVQSQPSLQNSPIAMGADLSQYWSAILTPTLVQPEPWRPEPGSWSDIRCGRRC